MKKNTGTSAYKNLLADSEFLLTLQFEVTYAIVVKGGYLPDSIHQRQKHRLINQVNFLSAVEKQTLVKTYQSSISN